MQVVAGTIAGRPEGAEAAVIDVPVTLCRPALFDVGCNAAGFENLGGAVVVDEGLRRNGGADVTLDHRVAIRDMNVLERVDHKFLLRNIFSLVGRDASSRTEAPRRASRREIL